MSTEGRLLDKVQRLEQKLATLQGRALSVVISHGDDERHDDDVDQLRRTLEEQGVKP